MCAEVIYKDGTIIRDELAVPFAHPRGNRPFRHNEYVHKFSQLTEGVIAKTEAKRFLTASDRLIYLNSEELRDLLPLTIPSHVKVKKTKNGLF